MTNQHTAARDAATDRVAGLNWLIWVQGLRGPEPQRVGGVDAPTVNRDRKKYVVAQQLISGALFNYDLKALAVIYPCRPAASS